MNATLKNERGVTMINRVRLVRFSDTQLHSGRPWVQGPSVVLKDQGPEGP